MVIEPKNFFLLSLVLSKVLTELIEVDRLSDVTGAAVEAMSVLWHEGFDVNAMFVAVYIVGEVVSAAVVAGKF